MARGISSNAAMAHSPSIPHAAIPMIRTASRQKATELPAIASVSEHKMRTDAVTREAAALKIPPPLQVQPCAPSQIRAVTKAMASMKVRRIRKNLVAITRLVMNPCASYRRNCIYSYKSFVYFYNYNYLRRAISPWCGAVTTHLRLDTHVFRGYLRVCRHVSQHVPANYQNACKYAPLRPATSPVRRFTKRLTTGSLRRASADALFFGMQ